ncbi:MAG: carbohydrate binding family 9 domain-containing protein [Ignavibacteria bacterium]|nr:carbohydrate binding family 9 domain-containing protein [Ignavibacteria bacterium]
MRQRYQWIIIAVSIIFSISSSMLAFGQDNTVRKHLQGNFPPPAKQPVVIAREVDERSITLDGLLDESVWLHAEAITDFFQMEPVQGSQNRHSTSVRVLFDERFLYIGVVCRDSAGRGGTRVQDLRRDFIFGENDMFAIQFDPQNLKRYCVSFQTTPYGSQRDLQVFDDNFRDNDWDALWQVRTNISDSGWTAEFAIPFATLRYDYAEIQDSVSWGISFFRVARRDFEQTVFPPVPQSYSQYRMVYAAQLLGLKLPKPSVNLRVQPYALYDFSSSKASRDAAPVVQGVPKFGGDAKWAVKPDATLDLTFNTDFAQADVDRAVNNLTRFNLFFPERRQFFLENSGVFAGVDNAFVRPFFSRAIGLANTQFAATPVPIEVGMRYVERNADRAIAGMFVRQRGDDAQSAANFGILRYVKNFGAQNNIGAMLTHRYDDASERLNFGGKHNTTLTLDGLLRPTDELTITATLTGSLDSNSSRLGSGGNVFAGYNTNAFYVGTLHAWATEKFLPGMGFVAQSNTMFHNPGGYAILRPTERTWWRRWDPGVFLELYHNVSDGAFQQASLDIFPVYFFFQDNAFARYSVVPTWQNINFAFAPVGVEIEQGRYFYVRHILQYSSDASAPFSFVARGELGGYFNGALTTFYGSMRYAPLPNIAFTAEYERNQFFDVGIRRENLTTDLITGAVRLALNPQVQLSVFYQYNSFDRRSRWNARGSWEFLPLSFLYLVFNDSMIQPEGQQTQAFIGKVVYTHQF